MFCGGAFCAWRRIASLVFLQRTLICVLGKRCIGSLSVCKWNKAQWIHCAGTLDQWWHALFWVQNRARTIMCAPWEHASIVCGICKVCIGLLFVNHNQAKQKIKTKQVASRWLGDASCLINASCVLRGSAGALEKEHASASLLTAKLAHASTHFLQQQQQQLMTCLVRACQTLVRYWMLQDVVWLRENLWRLLANKRELSQAATVCSCKNVVEQLCCFAIGVWHAGSSGQKTNN